MSAVGRWRSGRWRDGVLGAFTGLALIWAGCPATDDDDMGDDDTVADDDDGPPPATADRERDILHTGLVVDLANMEGAAFLRLAGSDSGGASFEVQGLEVLAVNDEHGEPLDHRVEEGWLDVGLPVTDEPVEIQIEYTFEIHDGYDGYMSSGITFVWPYYCGNLFPCHSEPADGTTFDVELLGVGGEGDLAIYPQEIPTECPSYQVAWVHGDFERSALGSTSAGTDIALWTLPGDQPQAQDGATYLLDGFEWFEETLGRYPFGGEAGSVGVDWGPGAYGGMEHHPFWHVGRGSLSDPTVHVHEAAHGWYGGGIRIACWEDFVLSEGTVTYLTARAIEQVGEPGAGEEVWADNQDTLDYVVQFADGIAWPEGCGDVDILADGLFSLVPYYKGAFFYRAVADEIGVDALDEVLSSFFVEHVGGAAGMQEMLDHIEAESGFDAGGLAEGWLRTLGIPE